MFWVKFHPCQDIKILNFGTVEGFLQSKYNAATFVKVAREQWGFKMAENPKSQNFGCFVIFVGHGGQN